MAIESPHDRVESALSQVVKFLYGKGDVSSTIPKNCRAGDKDVELFWQPRAADLEKLTQLRKCVGLLSVFIMEAKVIEKNLMLCPEGGAFIVQKATKAPVDPDENGERWIKFATESPKGAEAAESAS